MEVPIRKKGKIKMNLVANTFYDSQIGFFEDGLRNLVTSWDGYSDVENDRVEFGVRELNSSLIKDPGTANIYNTNRGSYPELSKLWLDMDHIPYIDKLIENPAEVKYDSESNKISLGDRLFIFLEKDNKSVKKIERYVTEEGRGRYLFFSCEVLNSTLINELVMPTNVVITICYDVKVGMKTHYHISYDEKSFLPIKSNEMNFEIPNGAFINNGITGEQYRKGSDLIRPDQDIDLEKINQLIEDAKKVK